MSQDFPLPQHSRIVATDEDSLAMAAQAIRDGKLVAFPTETVYGLGADATNERAVAAIFEAKDRPQFNPLIVHFADPGHAALEVEFDDRARTLARAFWPGPLTLVLPRREDSSIALIASAGLETMAVRVPDALIARALIETAERPIAAPSANRSGTLSPTAALHVELSLRDKVDIILDGGSCVMGIESTIIDLSGATPTLLRPGAIPVEEISELIGPVAHPGNGSAIKAPGMMSRHYAPSIPIRINVAVQDRQRGEAYLTFGPDAPKRAALNLSRSGDLKEAAANLFAMLRALDMPGIRGIAVQPIPDVGLGRAINDRLRRAASGEPASPPSTKRSPPKGTH